MVKDKQYRVAYVKGLIAALRNAADIMLRNREVVPFHTYDVTELMSEDELENILNKLNYIWRNVVCCSWDLIENYRLGYMEAKTNERS